MTQISICIFLSVLLWLSIKFNSRYQEKNKEKEAKNVCLIWQSIDCLKNQTKSKERITKSITNKEIKETENENESQKNLNHFSGATERSGKICRKKVIQKVIQKVEPKKEFLF